MIRPPKLLHALCWSLAAQTVLCGMAKAQIPVFAEDFDSIELEPAFTASRIEHGDGTDWSDTPPAGWTVDVSMHTFGTFEFDGWTFLDPAFWVATAGQDRDQFTKGQNVIAVADPDEWDDDGNPSTIGTFHSFLITPEISLAGVDPNTLNLRFDSSWRPSGNMTGTLTVAYDNGPEMELLRLDGDVPEDLNGTIMLPLNNPAGASEMTLAWGLTDAGNDWWWAIDNVGVFEGDPALTATIDRDSGAITLFNGSLQSVPISAYSIFSDFGGLQSENWLSIAENYDADSGGTVDPDSNWNEISSPDDHTELGEEDMAPATGATLAPGQTVVLSDAGAWIKSPMEDIRFEYMTDGSLRTGLINFVGNDDQPFVDGDFDFDNDLDLADWTILRENQHVDLSGLSPAEAYHQGDLTGDVHNNYADFVEFKRLFDAANGAGALKAALAAVPEPSTWLLLAIACASLYCFRLKP